MSGFSPQSTALIFSQPTNDGRFADDEQLHLRRLGERYKCVVLAFPPKAAGTFFRNAVIKAVNGTLIRAVHAQGGRDAQFYLPTFLAYYEGGLAGQTMVSHVHMQALPGNVHFFESFDIHPIIMKRSIPDMLASYWDMLDSDQAARADGLNCQIPINYLELSHTEKADFIVDVLGPWYASYYASWMRYIEKSPDRVCVLSFEEFYIDPVAALERCLEHSGLPQTNDVCCEALDFVWDRRDSFRFNKGVIGRGSCYFSPVHRERLRRMLGHYPVLAPIIDELVPCETAPSDNVV